MIQLNNLSYGYLRGQKVLKEISMELPEGHIYGLLGKNGVGKSTLLKTLTGALLGEGAYTLAGYDPRERQAEMQEQIRLVPEQEALYPMTPQQLADITAPLYPRFSQDVFHEALTAFEVPEDQLMTQMSLGQQKKALISLAFACQTPYLFLDEPTNGMDIPSKKTFRDLCSRCRDGERTVIISTHQVDALDGVIDAVIIMTNEGVLLNDTLPHIAETSPDVCTAEGRVDLETLFIKTVKEL